MPSAPAVSILVPNYNHARYLEQRLDSIVEQTQRDWELVILDDASTDDSLAVIERFAKRPNVRVERNAQNSGSPFKQWMKGLALARGELVWIAESDDACAPNFLEALLPAFRRPDVRLAYSNSTIIDEEGRPKGDYSQVDYLTSLSPAKWKRSYVVSANAEVNQGFGVKNTILSGSAVVFRKFTLSQDLQRSLGEMRLAGDWLFFAHAMRGGSIWYDARPLSSHRRHKESVIATAVADKKLRDFFREFRAVQEFIFGEFALEHGFEAKWEQYLRKQWSDFCPGKPFADIGEYYPLDAMRARLRESASRRGAPTPKAAPPAAAAPSRAASPRPEEAPVLFIGHDAYRAGAQMVLLTLLEEWKRRQPFPLRLILVDDGSLRQDYERLCPTLVLSDTPDAWRRKKALESFLTPKPRLIYSNTVANGPLLHELRGLDVPVVTHVHELQKSIERWAPGEIMASTLRCTGHFIAVSDEVAANLRERHRVPDSRLTVVSPFIATGHEPRIAPAAIRRELGLTDTDVAVFGCGTIDWRKGPDLFLKIAAEATRADPRLRFFWIGGPPEKQASFQQEARASGLEGRLRFLGALPNARDYFAAGQIFLLSSREDPFPLVALEAADAGLPIVCFEGAGGIPRLVGTECGAVVPFENVAAASQALLALAGAPALRSRQGAHAQALVRARYSSQAAAAGIANLLASRTGAQPAKAAEPAEQAPVILESSGYCPCCPGESTFVARHNWLRDHFLCTRCKSIPRERALMSVIESFYPQWQQLVIHESSPGGRGASARLQRECSGYRSSWFFPDRPLGSVVDGRRCENLEALTFEDQSIDLHITQDVMEHVFRPDLAFKEIARTLKPGGAHIFTVPLVHAQRPSRRRAELVNGQIRHLVEPPQYHGNPISSEGSLVTFDWGFDICRHIFDASGLFTQMVRIDDLSQGIRAALIEVLVTVKPAPAASAAL